jgi:hypothetical protein
MAPESSVSLDTAMKGIRHRRRANVVVEALKAHRIRQKKERLIAGGGWEDTGLVFTTPIGTALDARNVTR